MVIRISTVIALVDTTAFFDTIKLEVLIAKLYQEGVHVGVVLYIYQTFTQVRARVVTKKGRSQLYKMDGLRQGGRFSTIGAKQ